MVCSGTNYSAWPKCLHDPDRPRTDGLLLSAALEADPPHFFLCGRQIQRYLHYERKRVAGVRRPPGKDLAGGFVLYSCGMPRFFPVLRRTACSVPLLWPKPPGRSGINPRRGCRKIKLHQQLAQKFTSDQENRPPKEAALLPLGADFLCAFLRLNAPIAREETIAGCLHWKRDIGQAAPENRCGPKHPGCETSFWLDTGSRRSR